VVPVEEGEQRFAILRQAGDRLVVLGAVFVGEHVNRSLGRRAGRRAVNLAKLGFHDDLNREGNLVQHVGGLQMMPRIVVPAIARLLIEVTPALAQGGSEGMRVVTARDLLNYAEMPTFREGLLDRIRHSENGVSFGHGRC
jgi:hypothetical protein